MSRLESFAPNCLFTHDSNKSPNCAKTESTNVTARIATVLNDPNRLATSGPTIMSASAILVHLSGGYIEIHFHFFVMYRPSAF